MSKGESPSRKQSEKKSSPRKQSSENKSQDTQYPDTDQVVREIDELPPEKREAVFSAIRASYSGPIPPAEELQAYEQVIPGAADRIITMAEEEANHRRKMEDKMVDSSCGDSRLGLWLGFWVSLAALGLSGFIAYFSSPTAGSLLALASITSLVGVFVYGSRQQKRDSSQDKKK